MNPQGEEPKAARVRLFDERIYTNLAGFNIILSTARKLRSNPRTSTKKEDIS
jgi:hypothetical protein